MIDLTGVPAQHVEAVRRVVEPLLGRQAEYLDVAVAPRPDGSWHVRIRYSEPPQGALLTPDVQQAAHDDLAEAIATVLSSTIHRR